MGNGSVIVPGDVQRMSAGRGVLHSEFNDSSSERVHFLQIWIEPDQRGVPASYEQANVPAAAKRGRLALLAAPKGEGGAVVLHQDARVYAALIDSDEAVTHALPAGRRAYVHVARGEVVVNGTTLGSGDALRIEGEAAVSMSGGRDAEVLLFDLP
jgi:redox-sensitive bicupin YhaK (pirin superfamily)